VRIEIGNYSERVDMVSSGRYYVGKMQNSEGRSLSISGSIDRRMSPLDAAAKSKALALEQIINN
jgi:hypothetical protein